MTAKKDQLRDALGRLSVTQAARLAHALELQRSLGTESLPTETVLEGVRPLLRNARPGRAPTICRLVCESFEDFLSDRDDEPRIEGLIPRRSIKPWWTAARHVAPKPIEALTKQLRSMLAANPAASLDAFRIEVQQAAAGWARAIVEGIEKPKPDPQLVKLLPDALADDARAIARILPIATPVTAAIAALTELLERLQQIDSEGRIDDLVPEAVLLLKQRYVALSESHGTDARYLALAVTNRLAQPSQILRLAKALTWKPSDTLVANSEFASIGGRLVGDVQRLSRDIIALATRGKNLPPPDALSRPLATYMDQAEALLNEIGLRRESPWGEAILRTRMKLAEVFDHGLLEAYAQVALAAIPLPAGPRDASIAANGDADEAVEAARFIALLAQRGQRHGFAQPARDTLAALGAEIERRAGDALQRLQNEPSRSDGLSQALEAIAPLIEIVIGEGRGQTWLRQIANAMRASA